MESQKIINLLNSNNNESQKFATKRWYIIQDQSQGSYGDGADNTTIKYDTKVIKANLCDYSDAYISVTGNIENKPDNSIVAFKNCGLFNTCNVNINEKTELLPFIMPMYNLLEYSANYEDTTGSLYQFKRDEPPDNNGNITADTTSLKYKSISGVNNVKLVVPLKYISNFFRSLEMSSVNYKVDLELTWTKHSLICDNDDAAGTQVSFKITDTKLYVPIVTLSTKDNSNLNKQLSEGFKRTVHWNRYKLIPITVDAKTVNNVKVNTEFRKILDASFAGVNEYILPTQKITNYNVIIDDRNFYDQPINNEIKQYGKIRKIATGKGDNYATGCLLDYKYFKDFYKLIEIDLSKQKESDADPRSIQRIEFIGYVNDDTGIIVALEQ